MMLYFKLFNLHQNTWLHSFLIGWMWLMIGIHGWFHQLSFQDQSLLENHFFHVCLHHHYFILRKMHHLENRVAPLCCTGFCYHLPSRKSEKATYRFPIYKTSMSFFRRKRQTITATPAWGGCSDKRHVVFSRLISENGDGQSIRIDHVNTCEIICDSLSQWVPRGMCFDSSQHILRGDITWICYVGPRH